jgi:Protein of unknown function (DUF4232)
MTWYGQIGWRMAAVAAFVGTAALAIVLTRAPVGTAASLSSDFSGRVCATSGLQARLGLGAADADRTGRAGLPPANGTYYTLEFTNISHRACSLYGYPEVSAYRDSLVTGGQIGSAAVRDTSVRPEPVMLASGATAHAALRVVATAGGRPASCAPVTAGELRVTLPREGRPAFVPVHIPVCSRKGHVSLTVQAIQARPAVRGYAAMR